MPRLDPETGMRGEGAAAATAPPSPAYVPKSAQERLAEVIEAAMRGTLPRHKPLVQGQSAQLAPIHINMILDRAAGLKPSEIAERYDASVQVVYRILSHPDAQSISSVVLSAAAEQLIDPVARLQAYSNEMVDLKVGLARDPGTNPMLRNRIATEILDRAGFGPRSMVEVAGTVETKHTFQLPAQVASSLTDALTEAARVADMPFAAYKVMPQGSEAAGSDLALEAGHLETFLGASPETSSAAAAGSTAQERAA